MGRCGIPIGAGGKCGGKRKGRHCVIRARSRKCRGVKMPHKVVGFRPMGGGRRQWFS